MKNWKTRTVSLPALLLVSLLFSLPAFAEIPKNLNIQGMLTDADGDPVSNGWHSVMFTFYDALVNGTEIWENDYSVETTGGVFTVELDMSDFPATAYANPLWIEVTVGEDPPMAPRIPVTAAPYAQRAAVADSLAGGGGGEDSDWIISGDDIYRLDGRVYVGTTPRGEQPPDRDGENGEKGGRDMASSKFIVSANNDGIYCRMFENNTDNDGRAGVFVKRSRSSQNDGTQFDPNFSNTAITGYNEWGDRYTFGVAGYTWFDNPYTAGVLGASIDTDHWGALAYKDEASQHWGVYTPDDVHVGGTTVTEWLRLAGGAEAGYILTSDASGNASWSPPGSAVSDDDWVIQGNHLTHDTPGVVATGTDTPVPLASSIPQATVQVSALYNPAVVLDKTYGTFTRWSMYQDGSTGRLNFGRTFTAGDLEYPLITLDERRMLLKEDDGDAVISIQTDYGMEEYGPAIHMFNPDDDDIQTLHLDGHIGGTGGGAIHVKNASGNTQVTITGNHGGSSEGRIITPVLEITGGSDLSEQFDIEALGRPIEPGMVVSIDPERPGRLTLSGQAYDKRVAGVVSGAGGVKPGMLMGQRGTAADGELPVALVGRVYVHADATAGKIEPGDLLTTADLPGHAMRVSDPIRAAGAILGKAMTGLDEGQGLVLVLVSLQ